MTGLTRRGDQPSLRPDLTGQELVLDHQHVLGLPTGESHRVRVSRVDGAPEQEWVPVHGMDLDTGEETMLLVHRSGLPPVPEVEER